MRVALRNRNVRKFVRGVKQRTEKAKERGLSMRETRVEKAHLSPRASAVAMQKARSLLREAEKAIARRSYDEAERLLIQVLTTDPTSSEGQAHLAKLYIKTDRNAKAEALYRELLMEQSDISFHANLGLACYKQGKYEESCVAYQEAFNLDPKSPERAAALGRACIAAKHYEEAAQLLEFATERLARDVALLTMLADCYERLGNKGAAQDTYQKIHRLQPYDESIKEKIAALSSV